MGVSYKILKQREIARKQPQWGWKGSEGEFSFASDMLDTYILY